MTSKMRIIERGIANNRSGSALAGPARTVRGGTEIILDEKNAQKNVSRSWNIVSSENESLTN